MMTTIPITMYGAERRQHPSPLGPQHQLLLLIPLIPSPICTPTSQKLTQFVRDNILMIQKIVFLLRSPFTQNPLLKAVFFFETFKAVLQDPRRLKSENVQSHSSLYFCRRHQQWLWSDPTQVKDYHLLLLYRLSCTIQGLAFSFLFSQHYTSETILHQDLQKVILPLKVLGS